MPKVSVVIPLYNKEKHIVRAIQSVFAQTVQDFEIVVVDDGSTDGGSEVVRNIQDDRVKLIRQPNAGVSTARNRGIQEANGELIAFLDADDTQKTEFLATVLHLSKVFPEAGICCTAYELVEPSGKVWIPDYKGIPPAPWEGIIPDYIYSALGDPPAFTSAVAIPKRIFSKVGFFNVSERIGEDLDLWLRIAIKYPVAFSHKIGATYFRDAMNRANSFDSGIMGAGKALKNTALKALQEGIVVGKSSGFLQEYIYKKDLEAATIMMWAGQRKEAFGLLREIRTRIFFTKKVLLYLCLFIPHKIVLVFFELKNKIFGLK